MKNGPKVLLENEDHLRTHMGAWFPGERVVFRGKDLHKDLADMSWMELYLYGITGRKFSQAQIIVLNAIWSFTSFPDPRLWNNRVAALAGTTRSTGTLGISAAMAVSEASIYGRRTDIGAIDFLFRAKAKIDQGQDLLTIIKHDLKKYRNIFGYGRPIIKDDERNAHMRELLDKYNLGQGQYVQLATEVEKILMEGRWRFRLNYGGLVAAVCADFGFSRNEYYHYAIPGFLAGMIPCYLESSENNAGAFLPFRCAHICYEGTDHRTW